MWLSCINKTETSLPIYHHIPISLQNNSCHIQLLVINRDNWSHKGRE